MSIVYIYIVHGLFIMSV